MSIPNVELLRGNNCYNINATYIKFPKNNLLKSLKFEVRVSFEKMHKKLS